MNRELSFGQDDKVRRSRSNSGQMKKGLSLKYKFLMLLTSVPFLALAAYLALAINIFQADKIAYVFDSSVTLTQATASQIRSELGAQVNLLKPIAANFDFETNKLTEAGRLAIQNEDLFDAVLFFKRVDDKLVYQDALYKTVDRQPLIIEFLRGGYLQGVTSQLAQDPLLIRQGLSGQELTLAVQFNGKDGEVPLVLVAFVDAGSIASSFKSIGEQKMYLADASGQLLLSGSAEPVLLSSIFSPEVSEKLTVRPMLAGAEELSGVDKSDLLISYSPVGLSDLAVISSVGKQSALKAVETLIRQSVLFFIALFATTLIVSVIASGQLTRSLSLLFKATQKMSEGDFEVRVQVKSSDEIGYLANSFNFMAGEVSRLLSETAEKARMENELLTAQTVQETLFPVRDANVEQIMVSGYYQPASECGGDWWHYSRVGEYLYIWIGDATGHGAPAALITSAARSAASIIETLQISPAEGMAMLNRSIYDVSKGNIMMTFFLGRLHLKSLVLEYCNASHDPPFHFQRSEVGGRLPAKKDLEILNEINNPRCGQARETAYDQTTLQLSEGSRLFFYTDGIPELYNEKGEIWGERSFLKAYFQSNEGFPEPKKVVKSLLHKINEYRGEAILRDDLTFCQIKVGLES